MGTERLLAFVLCGLLGNSFDVAQDDLSSLFWGHSAGVDFDIVFSIAMNPIELAGSESNLPVASIKFSFHYNFEWASNADSDVAQVTQAI